MTSRTQSTFSPPVMEAQRWVADKTFSDCQLINVSQAAPVEPPPAALIDHMAKIIYDEDTHLYGPVLGLPALRSELAGQWSKSYGGEIHSNHVGITSGCNQAFSAAVAMLCGQDDEIILPTPFYFNHKMWLDMAGVRTITLACRGDMIPDPEEAAQLITEKTRAIVLVTPNNPCGVEYPADIVMKFYELAKERQIALIIDETYRDFHSQTGAPHNLFHKKCWDDTLIQLYSFSKAYRLTGHRVGSVIASETRIAEIEKFLDTVSICPNQLGQKAALWGLQNLGEWLANERLEILTRRSLIEENFPRLAAKGWKLLGLGAYFAYLKHPFDISSDTLARHLVDAASVLTLPGTMFVKDTDQSGEGQLRIAFANIDAHRINLLFDRLEKVIL
jgi:aspartate/methionine/tyrosine aminotransferase